MVDIITDLRYIDRRHSLPRAWLGNDLSPRERAQFIMQHMEHSPWLANTKEDFEIRLEAYVRPDFIKRHEALVDQFFELVSSGIPSINGDYHNVKLHLEFRAFFETVLTIILVEGEKVKEQHFYVDYNHIHSLNTQSSSSSSDAISAAVAAMNNNREQRSAPESNSKSNHRTCHWQSSPLGSLMDSPAVQQVRGQQQFQAKPVRYSDKSTGMPRIEHSRERQRQLVCRTEVPRPQQQKPQQGNILGNPQQSSDTSQLQYRRQSQQQQTCQTNEIAPQRQQRHQQQQQQKPQEFNDCCYLEQSTGGTWLERHGITATYKPGPKPKRRRSVLKRLAKKVNMWLISDNPGEYSSRRGGLEGRDDAKGNVSPPRSEGAYRLRERRH
ncbi:hypothetical protein PG985_008948 [Apiospora marii]|uniref:Uncharacterized protein n=1 Tax=Apiospora marii TaxID=335849 RepID=A0ABR1RBE0_9PEZI